MGREAGLSIASESQMSRKRRYHPAGSMHLFSLAIWLIEESEVAKRVCKFICLPTLLFGLLGFSSLFIPTTKEYCAIKAIPMIVNNDEVQEIPDKVLELATEWIEELKPENN